MRTLLILRHAKSSWSNSDMADHDRPLKRRGRRDAVRMGQLLLARNLAPQLIVSSTAKRARRTAKLIADALAYEGEIVLEHDLYHAGPTGYIRVLRDIDDRYQRVMAVGHNPGLEVLLEVLTGAAEWLPTAALAHVELPVDSWEEVREYIGGELVDLWTPKQIKAASR